MVRKNLSSWTRWVHIYLSMFSFAILLFFAVTGITLNHPEWTEGKQQFERFSGEVKPSWVALNDSIPVARQEIVQELRNKYNIKARLTDFRIEEYEISVSFNGPGFVADAFINRSTGSYEMTVTSAGYLAVMNDIHKGRDTGNAWAVIIDISAILMIVVSLTGFLMIFFLKKRKVNGLWIAVIGGIMVVLFYFVFV